MATSDLRDARLLVTGGAGFIGSELVRQLNECGARVTVIDNLVNGKRENLADLTSAVRLEVCDIRDEERIPSLLSQVDIVLHLACLGVRHSIHSPLENHDVNATGTLRLLQWAREAGVRRFVYVSSSEVYGTARTVPMTEQHPTWPMTVYGASKLAGERYADAYWRTFAFPTVVVRPFNAYGPRSHHEGDCGEVIPKFMLRSMAGRRLVIHGTGAQTRDFTFVSDTAQGIILAATATQAVGETINLGQGKEISINLLAEQIRVVTGRETLEVVHARPRPGDVLRLCADGRKAAELIGFRPKTRLNDGLTQLRNWYEASGFSAETMLKEEIEVNWEAPGRS
jgi:UDP-glucose 4-epimerase